MFEVMNMQQSIESLVGEQSYLMLLIVAVELLYVLVVQIQAARV